MSAWLAENPELLHATLAIIDAWDEPMAWEDTTSSDSHDDGSSSPQSLSPRSSVLAPRKASKLSTNQRRRGEIQELCAQIKGLEAQIASLQNGQRAVALSGSLHMTLWQQIAENQRRLLRKAELEQIKLRGLVDAHASIANGMAKLMRKASDLQHEVVMQSLVHDPVGRQLDASCADPFERVELVYARMDDVFAHWRFHDGSSKFVDADVIDDLDREIVVQFRETWTIPFEALDVLDELWSFTRSRYEVKWRSAKHVTIDTREAFVTQFAAQAMLQSLSYAFAGQLVMRRFGESNAAMAPAIVISMSSFPSISEGKTPVQVWLEENSCLRVLPMPAGSPMTQVQGNYHISVKFNDDDGLTHRDHAATLAKFVLQRLHNDVEVKQNTIHAVLLQAASA